MLALKILADAKGEINMATNNLVLEDARIGFRNFSGKEGRYNPEGRRNFCVFIDDDTAHMLESNNWNVRWLQPKDPAETPQAYIQVNISFDNIPPKVVMITSRGKTILDEDSVNVLDWAEIENVDIIIRPYMWDVGGRTGIKGYVKSLYVTIAEDEFESKYYDVPDSAINSLEDD